MADNPTELHLSAAETRRLRRLIDRWELAANTPHGDATTPIVDLACEVRDLLNAAGA